MARLDRDVPCQSGEHHEEAGRRARLSGISRPPERVAEVEDFVDFLTVRDQDRRLIQAATRMSEDAFRAVWDNADDAEYDNL